MSWAQFICVDAFPGSAIQSFVVVNALKPPYITQPAPCHRTTLSNVRVDRPSQTATKQTRIQQISGGPRDRVFTHPVGRGHTLIYLSVVPPEPLQMPLFAIVGLTENGPSCRASSSALPGTLLAWRHGRLGCSPCQYDTIPTWRKLTGLSRSPATE